MARQYPVDCRLTVKAAAVWSWFVMSMWGSRICEDGQEYRKRCIAWDTSK